METNQNLKEQDIHEKITKYMYTNLLKSVTILSHPLAEVWEVA